MMRLNEKPIKYFILYLKASQLFVKGCCITFLRILSGFCCENLVSKKVDRTGCIFRENGHLTLPLWILNYVHSTQITDRPEQIIAKEWEAWSIRQQNHSEYPSLQIFLTKIPFSVYLLFGVSIGTAFYLLFLHLTCTKSLYNVETF